MANGLYDFWKKDLADVYLEAIKPKIKSGDCAATLNTLYAVLDASLKILHPTMPYITEELYQRLPHLDTHRSESICIAPFPQAMREFEVAEQKMTTLLTTVKAIRSQLSAYNVASNAKPTICIRAPNDLEMFKCEVAVVQSLTKAGECVILGDEAEPEGCLKGFVSDDISIYVKVIGLIDIKLEIARVNKRVKQLEDLKDKLQKKTETAAYKTKTPENVQQANIEKLAGYDNELVETSKQMEILQKLI